MEGVSVSSKLSATTRKGQVGAGGQEVQQLFETGREGLMTPVINSVNANGVLTKKDEDGNTKVSTQGNGFEIRKSNKPPIGHRDTYIG